MYFSTLEEKGYKWQASVHLHRSLAPKATWKTKQQHHCNPDQSCPHFRVVRKVEHTLSLRFSPNSCMCVHCRFAYHNWKFLQFQWASVYNFTLSNLDCLKKCPIRQLRVLTLASTSSATKWVHRFFIFTSSLSLKMQWPRITRLTTRWDMLLCSKLTTAIPKM